MRCLSFFLLALLLFSFITDQLVQYVCIRMNNDALGDDLLLRIVKKKSSDHRPRSNPYDRSEIFEIKNEF
jgi:hypothetical protein